MEDGGATAYQVHPQIPWNYALDISSAEEIRVPETNEIKPQPWDHPAAPIVLGVRGAGWSSGKSPIIRSIRFRKVRLSPEVSRKSCV